LKDVASLYPRETWLDDMVAKLILNTTTKLKCVSLGPAQVRHPFETV